MPPATVPVPRRCSESADAMVSSANPSNEAPACPPSPQQESCCCTHSESFSNLPKVTEPLRPGLARCKSCMHPRNLLVQILPHKPGRLKPPVTPPAHGVSWPGTLSTAHRGHLPNPGRPDWFWNGRARGQTLSTLPPSVAHRRNSGVRKQTWWWRPLVQPPLGCPPGHRQASPSRRQMDPGACTASLLPGDH